MQCSELISAATTLIEAVTFDDSGAHGRGGKGGLLSRDTIRKADELRVIVARCGASGEAVAWRWYHGDGWTLTCVQPTHQIDKWEPLYTHPAPASDGMEALRRLRALVLEHGSAAQKKANGHRNYRKFATIRQEMLRVIDAALSRPDAPAKDGGWRDDPAADERWCDGLDYGQTQLCIVLGIDPQTVNWDAATETLDGDVHSVIGNILTMRFGEDWQSLPPAKDGPQEGEVERAAKELLAECDARDAEPELYDEGITAGIRLVCAAALRQQASPSGGEAQTWGEWERAQQEKERGR